jgi:hypothetical protein
MTVALLPPGFDALEPFVDAWAIAGAAGRAQQRNDSTEAERFAFYEAAKDLAPAALDYLDRKPLPEFDDAERRLMNLILSLAHVAPTVEALGSAEAQHARDREHLKITRASSDLYA